MKEKQIKCGLYVCAANPEKGKHLETASITLEGESIDLVNLRAPGHTEHKSDRFGTATEDAMLRDLTVNSLFYNINESKVEDLTEKGI